MSTEPYDHAPPSPLTPFGRWGILFVAFFGWFFAGFQLAISSIVMRDAAVDLLPAGTLESEIGHWFGLLTAAFLFGAAAGGYLFGLIGDRIGRARAMAASLNTKGGR
jgi:MFS family permease